MAQQKGGIKLRRSGKHKGKYEAQKFRTARNKAAARTRIARRKLEKPNPGTRHHRRKARRAGTPVLTQEQAYERLLHPKAES